MDTNLDKFTGEIKYISEPQSITREGKAPFKKTTIAIMKSDGRQMGMFEYRKKLPDNVGVGTIVTIDYYWSGSIKGDRCFNNIVISKLTVDK